MTRKTLGDVLELQRGYDLPESVRRPGTVPVIGSAGITGFHDTVRVRGPGVTIGRSGASFGKATYVRNDFWPHNAALYVKDFKGHDVQWVRYLLESIDFSSMNSGSAQQSLNRNYVYRMPVVVPPSPVQRRIAAILSAYDDLIENCERRIRVLDEMARALYREWFVEFRYPGHEEVPLVDSQLGFVPSGWSIQTLATLCRRMESGGTPKRNAPEFWKEGTVDWFKTGDLNDCPLFASEEKITEKALAESSAKLFEPGTILMAIYGAPTVGRLGILTRAASCNQAALGMVPKAEIMGVTTFYFLLFELRAHFNALAQGAAQQNISKEKVAGTSVAVPPRPLLSRFEAVCDPLVSQRDRLVCVVRNLRQTRDLLLPRLLSGQLSVEDVE
jgi:type I restriction enzyme S subunit